MTKLEAITPNTQLRGILPDRQITVISTQWFGSDTMELTWKDSEGTIGQTDEAAARTTAIPFRSWRFNTAWWHSALAECLQTARDGCRDGGLTTFPLYRGRSNKLNLIAWAQGAHGS